jgi:penicillin-binding protein-related factor A (putative recombinase)
MKKYDKVYLANASDIEYFRQTQERKSIPITWFEEYCIEIDVKELDFLEKITKNIG